MRFFPDDLGKVVRVQWYFCDENANYVPWATPFRSRAWDRQEHDGGQVLGEDPHSITSSSGRHVAHGPGVTVCGSPDAWRNGVGSAVPLPKINAATGLPCCCGRAARLSQGAELLAGDGQLDTNLLLQDDGSYLTQDDGSRILWR